MTAEEMDDLEQIVRDQVDQSVKKAIAKQRLNYTDNRLLVIYVIGIIMLAAIFGYGQHTNSIQKTQDAKLAAEQVRFEKASIGYCQEFTKIVSLFDGSITAQINTLKDSHSDFYTPAQRSARISELESFIVPMPNCNVLLGG